jgi:predicted lipid-binding transport protein (Tim44 family)
MKLFITLLLISMLSVVQIAEAKRFGGGRSFGYSKSYSGSSSSKTSNTTAAGKKSGMGGLGKLLAAGAIGAALAYLFTSAGGGIGWILLAVAAFFIISKILRSRAMSQQRPKQNQSGFGGRTIDGQPSQQFASGNNHNTFDQNTAYADETETRTQTGGHTSYAVNGMMPDGTPETVFKHQGLNLFQQLQDLNNAASIEKVKGYLTRDMFDQLKSEISSNNEIAKFENLETDIVGFEKFGTKWVGSIKFSGKVKEDSGSIWENFEEIWHFDRDKDEHIWQLSGIQQIS